MENFKSYFYDVFNKCGEDELYDLIIDLYNQYVEKNDKEPRKNIINEIKSLLSTDEFQLIKNEVKTDDYPYLRESIKFFLAKNVYSNNGKLYYLEFDEITDLVNMYFDWDD